MGCKLTGKLESSEKINSHYRVNRQGDRIGCVDFCADSKDSGVMFLLNNDSMEIERYSNGVYDGAVVLPDSAVAPSLLTSFEAGLCVYDQWDNSLMFIEGGKESRLALNEFESVSDIKSCENSLLVTGYADGAVETREIDKSAGTSRKLADGYMFDKEHYYTDTQEDGAGLITVVDIKDGSETSLCIKSEHFLYRRRILGIEDGLYVVHCGELFENGSNSLAFETLRYYDGINEEPVYIVDVLQPEINIAGTDFCRVKFHGQSPMLMLHNKAGETGFMSVKPEDGDRQSAISLVRKSEFAAFEDNEPIANAPNVKRSEMIQTANGFMNTSYAVTKANINNNVPSFIKAPGTYTKIPYCWGGFDSVERFKQRIGKGFFAGNVNCVGNWKDNTAGIDCSGFVSRCWKQEQKLSTTTIPGVCQRVNYSQLKSGDALNYAGSHVRMLDVMDINAGTFICYESTVSYGGSVCRHSYDIFNMLKYYTPLRYTGVVD